MQFNPSYVLICSTCEQVSIHKLHSLFQHHNPLSRQVLQKYAETLMTHRALYCTDISSLSKFTLLQQRESWRSRSNNVPGQVASMLEGRLSSSSLIFYVTLARPKGCVTDNFTLDDFWRILVATFYACLLKGRAEDVGQIILP